MASILDNLPYPFDPTGEASTNLFTLEQHVLTAVNYRDYHFIIPRWAPFFVDGSTWTLVDGTGASRDLKMGVDWIPCFQFISASRACAKPIWGGAMFLNTQLSGVLKITYQTLGGIWTLDEQQISELLAYSLHNPRVTAWEEVVELPIAFPPIDHEWDLVDMVGASEIVEKLGEIEAAIRASGGSDFEKHLTDFDNPHRTTAAQVGLDQVCNFPIASDSDADQGTSNTVYATPYTVSRMINGAAGPGAGLAKHIADHNNPHQVTADQTGAYDRGTVDNLLAKKLDTTGTAADTTHFNGRDENAYAQWVLAQTAANSLKFDGLTPAQFTAQVLQGKAADSAMFNGQTPAEFTASVLAGKAADSALFNGQTPDAYALQVLQGTAANASKFGGQTPAEFTTSVLQGTAANSNALGGMSLSDLLNRINQGGSGVKKTIFAPSSGETATDYWSELAQFKLPASQAEAAAVVDSIWLFSGGDTSADTDTPFKYVRISTRAAYVGSGKQPTIEVVDLGSFAGTAQFGYTIENVDDGSGAVPTVRLWLHTGPNVNSIQISSLSPDSMTFATNNRVAAAPAGIQYITADAYARQSTLNSALTQMTTMFNTLADSISGTP